MEDKATFRKRALRTLAITALILASEIIAVALLWGAVNKKAVEVAQKQLLLASFREELASFEELERDYKRVSPFTTTLTQALPAAEDLNRVIDSLENTALRTGSRMTLTLQSQFPVAAGLPGVNAVSFSAVLDGGYDTVRRYLQELGRIPVFVSIDSLAVSSPSSIFAGGTVQLQGKIFLR